MENSPRDMIDSKIVSDPEIIQLFDEIKNHFNEAIMEEDEKTFFIFVSDMCCQDLLERVTNRKDGNSTDSATQIDMNGRCP